MNAPIPSERRFDFAFRTRPAGLIEAAELLLALALRLTLAFIVWFGLLELALAALPHAPPTLAYALGGWLNAAAAGPYSAYALFAALVAVSLRRRARAPTGMVGSPEGWWWTGRGRRHMAWQSADVRSVFRLGPTLAWLLIALPFAPRRLRPVSGALHGWVGLHLRGHGLLLMPLEHASALRVALRMPTHTDARKPAPGWRRAALRWAGTSAALMVVLVPPCAIVNILGEPSSQAWISEFPARLALRQLTNPEDDAEATPIWALREAVAAGNPAVVRAVLASWKQSPPRIVSWQLRSSGCVRSLTALAELDAPPRGIAPEQRAAFAAAVGAMLAPFERSAELVPPDSPRTVEAIKEFARDTNLDPRCRDHPLPYWRSEWSARALWPTKGADQPLTLDMRAVGAPGATRVALEAGQLDARQRYGPFDQTLLMMALDAVRWQRSVNAAPSFPEYGSQLRENVQVLSEAHLSDLLATDRMGRSVAYMAAAAGESALMRRAVEASGGQAMKQATSAGLTLLHAAAAAGNPDDIEWLVQHGARLDATDAQGRTPLHLAASPATAIRLRELGAAPHALDHQGRAPQPPHAASGASAAASQ